MMRLRRALAPQVRREGYNLARMSGMLDLSRDEKAGQKESDMVTTVNCHTKETWQRQKE